MQVDKVNYGVFPVKPYTPNFEGIHIPRYFIKCEDGQFRQITNSDTIQTLQGKIVRWLNKSMNDAKQYMQGKVPKVAKNESPADKALKERLVNFFINNDKDYRARRAVKSVYITPLESDKTTPYILSGNTVDFAGDGKPIGRAHRQIRESRDFIRTYYRASEEQAKNYVSPSDALKLANAKAAYHKQSEECVRKLMADDRVDKSFVDFYFDPVIGKKSGKVQKYNLVNAIFKKYMIGPRS